MKNRDFVNPNVDTPGPVYTMRELRVMRTPLTQAQAAALIGVSPATISLWEMQGAYPSVKHIAKIEAVYGVDIHDIDFGDGTPRAQSVKEARMAAYYRNLAEVVEKASAKKAE